MENSLSESAKFFLGVDFVTPEEVAKVRKGIIYPDEQIVELFKTIPSVEVLKWCKAKEYAIMSAPPMPKSMLEVRALHPEYFYTQTGGWYSKQKFASEDTTSPGWILMKKRPVSDSTSRTWNQQNMLLTPFETPPNAAEMSWFITTYFSVRGVQLFEEGGVRVSSLDSDGHRVAMGLENGRIIVNVCRDDTRARSLSLAACVRN